MRNMLNGLFSSVVVYFRRFFLRISKVIHFPNDECLLIKKTNVANFSGTSKAAIYKIQNGRLLVAKKSVMCRKNKGT